MKLFLKAAGLWCVAIAGIFVLGGNLLAEEEVDLDKIVVTPYGYEEAVTKTAASVTVIGQAEIKRSNAKTIADALKACSNINVKDYYGTGIKVAVDLNGFGEFAQQNTLVLVNGRRVNEIDLSGVAWTQIPLESVERIEIVRGRGAVLYGDGASNGVVNIITKKGTGKPAFTAETQVGSYGYNKQLLSMSGSEKGLTYFLSSSSQFTNGYRDNSDYGSKDVFADFGYEANEKISFGLSGSYHDADYGLPGALRQSQLLTHSRRDTLFPDDTVGERDWFTEFKAAFKPADDIVFNPAVSFRRRTMDDQLVSSQAIDGRRIDTVGFTPSLVITKPVFDKNSTFKLGYDLYHIDSNISAYSGWGSVYYDLGLKTRQTNIDKDSSAVYANEELSLTQNLQLNAGYRYEQAKYNFLSLSQDGPWSSDSSWSNTAVNDSLTVKKSAADIGLSYLYAEHSNVFANYERSFRMPTTDEYYSLWTTPPVNIDLKTQTSDNYTLGVNHTFNPQLKTKASLFWMNVDNELFYDARYVYSYSYGYWSGANTNYDKTIHRGLDTEVDYDLWDNLRLRGGYTFTEAFFDGGKYDGNQIPLVPRHKLSAGLNFKFTKQLALSATANYYARQYFINDQAHNYTPLQGYTTVDGKLSYELRDIKFFAGVNNIFDEKYCEYGAVSTTANEKGYYPSPGRNYIAGASVRF